MLKRLIASTLAGAFMAGTALAADPVVIAFAGQEDLKNDAEYVFIHAFSESLKEHGIETVVHPANTLGKEEDRLDQVAQGLINVNVGNVSMLFKASDFSRTLFLLFIMADDDQFDAVMEKSGAMDRVNEEAASIGIRIPGYAMRGGTLGLFNTQKPVTKLEDVKEMRLRAQNGDQIKFFESWGAKGTVVSWAETPQALQTGVASGHLNPPSTVVAAGQVDLLKYYTPLDAGPVPKVIMFSDDWYQSLDGETRTYVDEATRKGIAANRAWAKEQAAYFEKVIADGGIQITPLEPGERDKFIAATKGVWAQTVPQDYIDVLSPYLQ